MLVDLAQRAVANAGGLGLAAWLARWAGIDDVRAEGAIVADRLADQVAILVDPGELDDAGGRRAIRL